MTVDTFAFKWASVLLKLRKAKDSGTGVTYTHDEVVTLIEGIRLINSKKNKSN